MLFFYPAAGVDGTPGGWPRSVLSICKREGIKAEKVALDDLFLGSNFSDEQIKHALKNSGSLEKAEYNKDNDFLLGEPLRKAR